MKRLYDFVLKQIKNNKSWRKQLNELNWERKTPIKELGWLSRCSNGLRDRRPGLNPCFFTKSKRVLTGYFIFIYTLDSQ